MRTVFLFFLLLGPSCLLSQQDITGVWKMVSGEGSEIAQVRVVEKDGTYRARVISFGPSSTVKNCHSCSGKMRGLSLLDLDLFWGLKRQGPNYFDGLILDPESGKEYSLVVYPKNNKLEVRGYLGVPLFGKSQFWIRSGN